MSSFLYLHYRLVTIPNINTMNLLETKQMKNEPITYKKYNLNDPNVCEGNLNHNKKNTN